MKYLSFLALLLVAQAAAQPYDLLLKNGHVIDPKNGINSVMDVAIVDGVIARVAADLDGDAAKVVDASGLYVAPGFIDLHAHLFHGTEDDAYLSDSYSALPPDGFTFRSGVTTAVDVGGAGWRNFKQFHDQTIVHSKTRVLSFLNIVGWGMKGGAIEQDKADMDSKLTAMVANQYPGVVVGVKVAHYSGRDWDPVDRAVEAGQQAGVPIMVDFGRADPPLPLNELLLEHLRPGDIFTHTYAHVSDRHPIVDEEGKLEDFAIEAQQRGVIFDVGHGGGSFMFEQAVPATQQGLWPNTISTDLHTGSMNGGMKTQDNVMSKFVNLGMPIQKVVEASTWVPARVISREDLGHLDEGAVADVVVFGLAEGEFGFVDTGGYRMAGTQKIVTELTVREGQVVWDLNGMASVEFRMSN